MSKLELKIAEYMEQLFEADVDMENEILVGDFLHGQMQYTKYLSERGNVRKIALLIQDCSEYYKELANNPLEEELNVRKIFRNRNFHNYDICLMAMFLKIPVQSLFRMKLPEKLQCQEYDENVRYWHGLGLNCREIADKMGTSYDVVKLVMRGKFAENDNM